MLILGIDTSNYATSLAAFETESGTLIADVKQFLPVKEGQLGLRQSDAVFHHTQNLPLLLEQLAQKLIEQGRSLGDVAAVGVSQKPRPIEGSYMPCFSTGVTFATGIASVKDIPLIKTTHQQGHIASALFACNRPELFSQDVLVFHVSGGTTDLLLCHGYQVNGLLGTSSDLYAGQAVDRIGVRLGYDFPAGFQVSQLALKCKENIPTPKVSVTGCQCSLSGLENQCISLLAKGYSPEYTAKYCLVSVARTLEKMMLAALKDHPGFAVVFAGGVMSSPVVRQYIQSKYPWAYFVEGKFASDNAIGVSVITAKTLVG